MSEYRWYVKHILVGVVDASGELIGVIRRSGWCYALGHFCHVKVSINGKEKWASGAEDRIHPFHSVSLEAGEKWPKFELRAIGWCKDGNTFAFMNRAGKVVDIDGNKIDPDFLKPVRYIQ